MTMKFPALLFPLLCMLLLPILVAPVSAQTANATSPTLSISSTPDLEGSTIYFDGTSLYQYANTTASNQVLFQNFTGDSFLWVNNGGITYNGTISSSNFNFQPGVPCTYWTVSLTNRSILWLDTFYTTPAPQLLTLQGLSAFFVVAVGALFYAIPIAINIGVYLSTRSIGLGVNAFLLTAAAGMYLDPILRLPSELVVALGIAVLFYQLFIRRKL